MTEVVPHLELLTRARQIAAAIADNNTRAVRALLASYRDVEAEFVAGGYDVENRAGQAWTATALNFAAVGRVRDTVIERGRRQSGSGTS